MQLPGWRRSCLQVVGINCRFLQAAPGKQRAPSAAAQAIRHALDGGRAKGVRLLNYMKDGTPVFNDLCASRCLPSPPLSVRIMQQWLRIRERWLCLPAAPAESGLLV